MAQRTRRYIEVACPTCGELSTKRDDGKATRRFCSLLCRDVWRLDQPNDPMFLPWSEAARTRARSKRNKDLATRWHGATCAVAFGPCAWCEKLMCRGKLGIRAYCSEHCSAAAKRVRRRGREAQDFGFWNLGDFMRLARRFDFRCAYCGTRPDNPLQPDHVVPVSRGGSNTIANLLPSCLACNADKRDLLLDEWNADRERRGLPLRATSWAGEDRRFWHLTAA